MKTPDHFTRHMGVVTDNIYIIVATPIVAYLGFMILHKMIEKLIKFFDDLSRTGEESVFESLTNEKQQAYVNDIVGLVNAAICLVWVPVAAY